MAQFRFYAELNEFLPPAQRGREFHRSAAPHASLKHTIEALGVPHTEVGLVLRNGERCPLDHRPLHEGDQISVYPAWRRFALGASQEAPRFIADAHLARLARYLRFAGYDTLLHEHGSDGELAAEARRDWRIVLTRDRQLLMHRDVEQGCYLRPEEPLQQLHELADRLKLDLRPGARPARCTLCNDPLHEVAKAEVADALPPCTREAFERFWRCPRCGRVYWHGSHWKRLQSALNDAAAPRRTPA